MKMLIHLFVSCGVVVAAARAESPEVKPAYPLTARLAFGATSHDRCLVPDESSCDKVVSDAVQRAYESAVRRTFRSAKPDAPADLEITVSPVVADVVEVTGGREVIVETRVILASTTAGEIDRLTYSDRSPVLGSEPESVVNAIDRASRETAQHFERRFADSKAVFNWMRGRGVEPVDSAFSWPARADRVVFADFGVGPVIGGGDGAEPGLLGRFGIAGRWFVVQGVAGRWVPSFKTAEPGCCLGTHNGELRTLDLGLEAGLRIRRGEAVEFRAGGGAHVLWGTAVSYTGSQFPPESSFSTVTPSLFGAFQYTLWPTGSRLRLRLGLEVRKYISTTVGFPEFSRTVALADTYIGGYLGLETPFGSAPARGGAAAR
jgi:hypothetical protein